MWEQGYSHSKLLKQDPREASVFICGSTVSDKTYLLAVACGGCLFLKDLLDGEAGWKIQYKSHAFRCLQAVHGGIHCSETFRLQHAAFLAVLGHVVSRHGWHKLKEERLEKKRSICLVAKKDKDKSRLKRKANYVLEKSSFVRYLTQKCQSLEGSFLVVAASN